MDRKRILIADASPEFREALSSAVQGIYLTRITWDGISTLQQLRSFKPDILILDLMLPGLDGITLLHQATADGTLPTVLATTRYLSDYIVSSAEKAGVEYLMVKPCDIQAIVSHITEMAQRTQAATVICPDNRSIISNLLLRLGIPTKVRGYAYLREAILQVLRDPAQSITKELYPAVAAQCNATAVQVERSIRSAISNAWAQRDEQVWQQYFGISSAGSVSRPSNGAFITRLADHLSLK